MSDNFYIYALLDPRKPGNFQYGAIQCYYEPFYVGKGSGRRCYGHFTYKNLIKNTPKNSKIKKIIKETGSKPLVIKLFENLTEQDAFYKEIELISLIGRHNLGTGPLTNLCEGGEGSSGYKHKEDAKIKISKNISGENNGNYRKTPSEETREKMRQSALGNKNSLGKYHSEETREKQRQAGLVRIHSEETKKKRSESMKLYWERKKLIKQFENNWVLEWGV